MEEFTWFIIVVGSIFVGLAVIVFLSSEGSVDEGKVKKKSKKKRTISRGINLRKKAVAIPDRFETLEELQEALRTAGLESSNLIIGIDYTKSNLTQGKRTFASRSLHDCSVKAAGRRILNPYQQVISIIGKTLQPFDDDNKIPVYGFGMQTCDSYNY